jgi:hypothetical protein
MGLALRVAVRLRTRLLHLIAATLIVFTALVGVGVTAPADAPFTIAIRPVFVNLGFDIEIKLWTMHVHFAWSAIPPPTSTKPEVPTI